MDTVLRALLVFVALWILIRISGRRTLGKLTSFDFVLFLIIGGATQRALTGEDYSLTNAALIVSTLILLNVLLSLAEARFPSLTKWLKGVPMVIVEHGRPLPWRLRSSRVTEDEIMAVARETHGLERMEQIKFAILEASGHISIIPEQGEQP